MAGDIRLAEAFVCDDLLTDDASRRLVDELDEAGVERVDVSAEVFEKLAFGDRAEGVVVVAHAPNRRLADLALEPAPVVAVLETVEKPGNLGAVLRSADGAGVNAVIATGAGVDLYSPNTIRASLGTLFTQPVLTATLDETIAWLHANRLTIYAARVDAEREYTQADFRQPSAIVLGSEADGLSDAWRADDITAIRLPMRGAADSLNVSASAAVLFYEALRQRQS